MYSYESYTTHHSCIFLKHYLFKLSCVAAPLFSPHLHVLKHLLPRFARVFFPVNYMAVQTSKTNMQLFVQTKSEQPTSFRQHNQKQLNTALHSLSLQNSLVYRASIVSQILMETVYHSRILFSQAILD